MAKTMFNRMRDLTKSLNIKVTHATQKHPGSRSSTPTIDQPKVIIIDYIGKV